MKFKGLPDRDNKYLSKDQLEAMGFGQLVKQCDERVAAEAAGLDLRCVGGYTAADVLETGCGWSGREGCSGAVLGVVLINVGVFVCWAGLL